MGSPPTALMPLVLEVKLSQVGVHRAAAGSREAGGRARNTLRRGLLGTGGMAIQLRSRVAVEEAAGEAAEAGA